MLRRIGNLILSVVLTFAALFAVEIGYRIYLSANLASFAGVDLKSIPNPTFRAYGSPPPWIFNEAYGFDYYDGVWSFVQITDGKFGGCQTGPRNFGRFENATEEYRKADLKILILGSSFTMLPDQDGRLVNQLLEEVIEDEMEFDAAVLNISRDATGVLTSFDIAAHRLEELKPDLVLFVGNGTSLGYQRHWRFLPKVTNGFRQLAYSLDPHPDIDNKERVVLNPYIVADRIDEEWCNRQNELASKGVESELDRQMIDDLIAVRSQIVTEQKLPLFVVDFTSLRTSFVFNFAAHGDPFHNMEVFKPKTVHGSVDYDDYREDPRFLKALKTVEGTGIPYLLIYIPILSEMRAGPGGEIDYVLTGHGVAKRGRSLEKSLVSLTGKDFFHLYSVYSDELKANPLALVRSEKDNHPSSRGVHAMAEALSLVVFDFLGKEGNKLGSDEKQGTP